MKDNRTAQSDWDPSLYDQKHSFVTEYGEELLALLGPQPTDRILDLGCGTGHLTRMIADRGAYVIGLDSSQQMVESARQTYPEIEFTLADASDFAFDMKFEA